MNDRLKFRVWCKSYNEWERNEYAIINGGLFWVWSNGSLHPANQDNHIVEQCTGLKDVNGKLIYEGDIIKHHFWRNGYMKWRVSEACFVLAFKDRSPTHQWHHAEVEVIGNIHENEDLLK